MYSYHCLLSLYFLLLSPPSSSLSPTYLFPLPLLLLFQVTETKAVLTTWMQHVNKLRSQYHWLLFFSVPKLLLLYRLLQEKKINVEAIVHEISFLCSNEQASWKNAHDLVEVSGQSIQLSLLTN